ncbi:PIN/TRAM domain-containing protein [Anaerosphaera multitolerans]|uniref:PIN/TRAM domain-containing protein n=1 Tax=Anaerosphaera multitolerans TaxID=2487351 RepID=UPI0023EA5DEF|nr:PIN domain-containing protein [Anaerosphaera multitolerans]
MGIVCFELLRYTGIFLGFSRSIVLAANVSIIVIFAIIFFFLSPKVFKVIKNGLDILEKILEAKTVSEIISGSVGLIIGLIIAFFISQPINLIPIPYLAPAVSIIVYAIMGYLGLKMGLANREKLTLRIRDLTGTIKSTGTKEKIKGSKLKGIPKILDTSVIIDGRIRDICTSNFLEGSIVIPVFVLEELQHIADSSDGLKRSRGRRGLDIIKEMQENERLDIVIHQAPYDEINEVDSKLLQLTKDLGGKIVTNDYNLNKVAIVQGLEVLNINELANAVKPVYLPGEEMSIQIVKTGKEQGQGLGYLDDGTMIVVESGKGYLGETINVMVTSVLQTAAGKMIFAKPMLNGNK